MAAKEFYTTGQAARLLNVATSTVSRMFDRGLLNGRQNPFTGKRLVSRESIAPLMKQCHHPAYGVAVERRKILVGTADERLSSSIRKAFFGGDRVEFQQTGFGGDILIRCSKQAPNLLIIGEEISDITCAQIIQFLRNSEEFERMKILCFTQSSEPNRCLGWGADVALRKADIEGEQLKERIFLLLELEDEHPEAAQAFRHQRRWPRASLALPAKIWVYRLRKAHVREQGEARLDNISMGGAFLSVLRMEKDTLPAEPFRILLEVDEEPLRDWRVHCKAVRLESNGSMNAGVQFVRLSKPGQQMIEALFSGTSVSGPSSPLSADKPSAQPESRTTETRGG